VRLKLDIECPVARDVPQPEFLSILRALQGIVTGKFELMGDDYTNGVELMDEDGERIIGRWCCSLDDLSIALEE
jgi:hypothetical protein